MMRRHAMTSDGVEGFWEIYDVTWPDIRLSAIRLMSIDQCQSAMRYRLQLATNGCTVATASIRRLLRLHRMTVCLSQCLYVCVCSSPYVSDLSLCTSMRFCTASQCLWLCITAWRKMPKRTHNSKESIRLLLSTSEAHNVWHSVSIITRTTGQSALGGLRDRWDNVVFFEIRLQQQLWTAFTDLYWTKWWALAFVWFSFFLLYFFSGYVCARLSWSHSAFESTLNSSIVSYRIDRSGC